MNMYSIFIILITNNFVFNKPSWSLTMTSFLLTLIASTICGGDQPFFPKFHIRPPSGHVNDPNGDLLKAKNWFIYGNH